MRKFSEELQAHLNSGATTLCTCWIVKRTDSKILGFTDHDLALIIEGTECVASSGLKSSQAVSSLGLSVDNQEVEGALTADIISEEDIVAGAYDGATVEIWLVNWSNIEERHLMRSAILGEISRQDHYFSAELRSQTALLDQTRGRTFSKDCDAVLGDSHCGVNLNSPLFRASGEVAEIIARESVICSGCEGYEENWFTNGSLKWVSGKNSGQTYEVSSLNSSTGRLQFWNAPPHLPEIGDQFELFSGCNKTFETCKKKFGNHLNFRGFPHMPGPDFALGYADRNTVHDGSPLTN